MVEHETPFDSPDAVDPLDTAIAQVLSEFPVSAARFAPRSNVCAYGLFNDHEIYPARPLSVKEAVALQAATNDVSILHAEAAALRHACLPLINFNGVPDMELLSGYAAWHSCLGDLLLTVTQAVHNQHISRNDFARVRQALQEDAARGVEFLQRLEALIHAE